MAAAAPEFERVVRDAMDAKGLSLVALARESRIDRSRWYSWFRGDHAPQPRSLTRAAQALGLSVTELLTPWGDRHEAWTREPSVSDYLSRVDSLVGAVNELVMELREARRPAGAGGSGVQEGVRRDRARQQREDRDMPVRSPERSPRDRAGEPG